MYTCTHVETYTCERDAPAAATLTFSNRSRWLQSKTYPFCYNCLSGIQHDEHSHMYTYIRTHTYTNTRVYYQRRIVNPLDALYEQLILDAVSHPSSTNLISIIISSRYVYAFIYTHTHRHIFMHWVQQRNSICRESYKATIPRAILVRIWTSANWSSACICI